MNWLWWFSNSRRIDHINEEVKALRKEFQDLKLDVEIYHSKLKNIKNVKPVQEKTEAQNIKDSVLLPEIYGPTADFRPSRKI